MTLIRIERFLKDEVCFYYLELRQFTTAPSVSRLAYTSDFTYIYQAKSALDNCSYQNPCGIKNYPLIV